ncbi:MAG: hypothetical protein QXU18_06705 [Thermoplasmatales archaeon]
MGLSDSFPSSEEVKLRNLVIHLIIEDQREPNEVKSLADFLQCMSTDTCKVSMSDALIKRLAGKIIERPLTPLFLILYYLAFRKGSWTVFNLIVSHLRNEQLSDPNRFTDLDNELLQLYGTLEMLRTAYKNYDKINIIKRSSFKTILGYSASIIDVINAYTTVGKIVKSLILANFGDFSHIEDAKSLLVNAQHISVHTDEEIEHYFIIDEGQTDSVFLQFLRKQIEVLEDEERVSLKRSHVRDKITKVHKKLTSGVKSIPTYFSLAVSVLGALSIWSSVKNYPIPILRSVGLYAGLLIIPPVSYLLLVYVVLPSISWILENNKISPRFKKIFI